MAEGRRLEDTLVRYMEARAELIREMSIGAPLASPASSAQLNRLRDLQDAIVIIRAAVTEAGDLRQALLEREGRRSGEQERRVGLSASPASDEPFRPL